MKMEFEEMMARLSPTLRRITHRLNGHFTYFDEDDLFQEALEQLWLAFRDNRLNDKTDSYLLQGCYYHLKNYIRKMADRAQMTSLNSVIDEEGTALEDVIAAKGAKPDEACESFLIRNSGVTDALNGREKEIMIMSLDGMTVREIGERLGISHVMVVKIKKSIKNKCGYLKNNLGRGYQN